MLLVRRLLVALLLTAPLVATGPVPLPAARADDGREPAYLVLSPHEIWSFYGDPVDVTVYGLSEAGPVLGPVTVFASGRAVGTAVLEPTGNAWSEARFTFPGHLEPGSYTLYATFAGDDRFAPASTHEYPYDVVPAETSVSVTASPATPWAQQRVTVTATVTPSTDAAELTGTVTFRDRDDVVAVRPVGEDGTASVTTEVPAGSTRIVARYSGDAHFEYSEGQVDLYGRLVPTTTSVTHQGGSLTYGDRVHLDGRVTSTVADMGAPAGGAVTFTVDGHAVGTAAPVPGAGVTSLAGLDLDTLGAGPHRIGASYGSSPGFEPSTATSFDLVVAKRATSMSAAPVFLGLNPFAMPNGVLRATVRGGGTVTAGLPVTFTAGRTALCTATTDASGVAICDARTQKLALTLNGGYVATFAGDANNLGSSARGNLVG